MFLSLKRAVYKVKDMERATQWYRGVLGKGPVVDMPFAVHFTVGDTGLTLTPLAPNDRNTAESTVAYWEVTDIDEE
jgi:catechol-2,3-dioxygenase